MKTEMQFSSSDKQDNLVLGAVMAFLPFLFFLPYVIENKKYSPYCMFRANQSLITFVVMALLNAVKFVLGLALGFIPLVGAVAGLVGNILGIIALLYYVQNVAWALLGRGKRVFILGELDLLK